MGKPGGAGAIPGSCNRQPRQLRGSGSYWLSACRRRGSVARAAATRACARKDRPGPRWKLSLETLLHHGSLGRRAPSRRHAAAQPDPTLAAISNGRRQPRRTVVFQNKENGDRPPPRRLRDERSRRRLLRILECNSRRLAASQSSVLMSSGRPAFLRRAPSPSRYSQKST